MSLLIRATRKSSTKIFLAALLIGLTGCNGDFTSVFEVSPASTSGGSRSGSFEGLLSGAGLDTSSIQLNFSLPTSAQSLTIYRDGNLVTTIDDASITSYIDTGLTEGRTYRYTAKITLSEGKIQTGSVSLNLTTVMVNPPTFAGVVSVTPASNGQSATLNWNPGTGVVVSYFKIYANPGSSVIWTNAHKKSVSLGSLSTSLTGLGDGLTYSFGIRACSSADICDSNTTKITLAMPDDGIAPTTSGISQVAIDNGSIILTAPWAESNGAVSKRKVYQKTGTASVNIGDYSLVKTEVVSDLSNPITSIPITAGFSEGTTYSFIVRDEDPAGRLNSSLVAGTIAIGDLTAPSFSGISGLALGSPSDTRLVASWTAIASDASGASNYLLYQTSSSSGTPADPCGSSGTLTNTIDATQYTTGNTVNFTVTGLTPRTNYKVCVKAVDAAGNISSTSVSAARTTQDITAPAFDGVQSITYNSSSIQVGWNASPTSDIKEYKIKLWKNTATPNSGDITTLTRAHSSFSTGFSFTSSVFSFTDNDTVYAVVDACDDASPTYGTQNCTAFANSTAKNVLVPDATPPASFVGIKDATQLTTPAEGQVTVTWFAPSSWTDYRGFNIYTVNTGDNSITFLKDCPCSGNNCPNQITSCTVTGLDARRTYTFHVRAYDAAGNITTYLDPASNRSAKLTTDTTSPTFSSNLQSSIAAGVSLSWDAATDNQYASEAVAPAPTLTYKVYRKTGSNFALATSPSADCTAPGCPLVTQTTRTYLDTAIVEGVTYFYTTCVEDTSSNSTCDGTVQSKTIPDITAPSVTSLPLAMASDGSNWTLNWSMSDTVSSNANLLVSIRRKISSSASDFPSAGDSVLTSNTGLTSYNDLLAGLGTNSTNKFVNYRITVADQVNNSTSITKSVNVNFASVNAPFTAGTDSSYTFNSNALELVGGVVRVKSPTTSGVLYTDNVYRVDSSSSGTNLNTLCDSSVSGCNTSWGSIWTDLTAYYKFEGNGTDSKAGTFPGTIGSAVTFTTGHLGQAASISTANNVTSTINFGTAIAQFGTSNFSVGGWVKTTMVPATAPNQLGPNAAALILTKTYNSALTTPANTPTGGWEILMTGTGVVSMRNAANSSNASPQNVVSATGTLAINNGAWHHVMYTRTGSGLVHTVYVDGIQEITQTTATAANLTFSSDSVLSATPDLRIGYLPQNNSGNREGVVGLYDDWGVWKTTGLTASQVRQIYEAQAPAYTGTILSRVIDTETSHGWTSTALGWATTLPFFKELVGGDNSGLGQTSGLVGLWHLNEASGTSGSNSVLDSSGNNLHGTPNSVTFGNSGVFGKSPTFDGSTSFVSVANSPSLQFETGSISAWVKTSNPGNGLRGIVVKELAYSLFTSNQNVSLYDWSANQVRESNVSISDNEWHNLVVTFQSEVSNGTKIYVDGQSVLTTSMTVSSQEKNLHFGNNFNFQHFQGNIDEVGLWNRVLSPTEVSDLYSAGQIMSGNVGLWHMNETSGTTLADSSGNGATATLQGGTVQYNSGAFGGSIGFTGTQTSSASIPHSSALNLTTAWSISAWVNQNAAPTGPTLIFGESGAANLQYCLGYCNTTAGVNAGFVNGGWTTTGTYTLQNGVWTHLMAVYSGSANTLSLYANGVLVSQNTSAASSIAAVGNAKFIGRRWDGNTGAFKGSIDEIGLWNRALSLTEIQQLYRRGANRIKFQVRSCAQADCSDGSYVGPDGTSASYFSELQNNSALTLSNGAVFGTGNVLSTAPSLLFSNFFGTLSGGTAITTALPNNRYMQVRATMESDNTGINCAYTGGTVPCSPELKSVTVSDSSAWTEGLTISNSSGISFEDLYSFTQTLGANGCSGGMKYLLSKDGSTWYRYDGSAWTSVSSNSYSVANPVSAFTQSALINFTSSVGSAGGPLFYKAFLNSSVIGGSSCELDNLALFITQ